MAGLKLVSELNEKETYRRFFIIRVLSEGGNTIPRFSYVILRIARILCASLYIVVTQRYPFGMAQGINIKR